MRILSWVQNKLNGRQEKKRCDEGSCSAKYPPKPEFSSNEFSDWPQGLLSIGTFGQNDLREEEQMHDPPPLRSSQSSQDISDFTIEEVMKLQKELSKLLKYKPKSTNDDSETANIPLNRFLNCPSSLEVDRSASIRLSDDMENGGDIGDLSPISMIILRKARDLLADNRNAIKQKSISFLLKKMFVCRSGFTPAPCLRDPITVSRMEKLLRTILHKKICPQSSAPLSGKKYLENKPNEKAALKEQSQEKEENTCKWDKTDSDFIVLEM